MAKENYVILYGQVYQKPKIYLSTETGEYKGAIVQLKVLRRLMNKTLELRLDCPVILTKNPSLAKQAAELSKGDMLEVRGVLTTSELLKVSTCPHCGEKNKKPGVNVHVTPIFLNPQEKGCSEAEGLELLKKKCEISNLVMGIGTLCREPDYYEHTDENGKLTKSCAYQIAMNRRYHIKEDPLENRTDYPWVKSFGPLAESDRDHLTINAEIYVAGSLQTRTFEKNAICNFCGKEYQWPDKAMEIVPYATEYLRDYIQSSKNTPENQSQLIGG